MNENGPERIMEFNCPKCGQFGMTRQGEYLFVCPNCGKKQLSESPYRMLCRFILLTTLLSAFILDIRARIWGIYCEDFGFWFTLPFLVIGILNIYITWWLRFKCESGLAVTILGLWTVLSQSVFLVAVLRRF